MIPTLSTLEGEFGPDQAKTIRDGLRAANLPRLLSWLFRHDFRSETKTLLADYPGATPSDLALIRDNQATGARRVLDLLAALIGEEVKLPTPPFRKTTQ